MSGYQKFGHAPKEWAEWAERRLSLDSDEIKALALQHQRLLDYLGLEVVDVGPVIRKKERP